MSWTDKLDQVKKYIDENWKRPYKSDKNIEINQMSKWIDHQLQNYKNNKCVMKKQEIKSKWDQFIENYKEYFLSNEDIWINKSNQVKKYIDVNNKRPSEEDKNKDIKQLGTWIGTQNKNFDVDIKKCKQ